MNFRDTVCIECNAEKYARQCRNSRQWREDKARRYVDLFTGDFRCLFGLPLDNLPIGDNGPGPEKGTIVPPEGTLVCAHFVKVGCCKSACREGFDTGPHCKSGGCASYQQKGT